MKTETLNEEGSQFDTAGHEAQVEIYGWRERGPAPHTGSSPEAGGNRPNLYPF